MRKLTVLSALATLSATSFAAKLDMLGMGVLSGHLGSFARDINNQGTICGVSTGMEKGGAQAVLWSSGGGLQPLGFLSGDTYSEARGINDVLTTVGASGSRPMIKFSGNAMAALPLPNGRVTGVANDIGNSGTAVGTATDKTFLNPLPVMWNKGVTLLTLLSGGTDGEARRICDEDIIAGWSGSKNGRRAVLWFGPKTVVDLGVLPGFTQSEANGVNVFGEAVGFCNGVNGRRPFHYRRGEQEMVELPIQPWAVEGWATSISRNGLIVGTVKSFWGTHYAVYWSKGSVRDFNSIAPKIREGFAITEGPAINDRDQVAMNWLRYKMRVRGFLGKVVN